MSNALVRTAATAFGIVGLVSGPAAATDRLASLVWQARPVVVLADSPGDPLYRDQIASLDAQAHALAGYDIAVVRVTEPDPALRRKLGVSPRGFAVALVGKDGDVKKRWSRPVEPARIFALIDTMPMRQDEVRALRRDEGRALRRDEGRALR